MYVRPKGYLILPYVKRSGMGGIKHLLRLYPNYAAIEYARTHHTKHKQKGVRTQNYCQIYTNAKIQIQHDHVCTQYIS